MKLFRYLFALLITAFLALFLLLPIYTVVAEGYPQNAFALIRSEALSGIRPFLLSGERKLGAWLKGVGQKKVFMRNYRGNFKNLNAFEEISSAEAEEISKNFQKDP